MRAAVHLRQYILLCGSNSCRGIGEWRHRCVLLHAEGLWEDSLESFEVSNSSLTFMSLPADRHISVFVGISALGNV